MITDAEWRTHPLGTCPCERCVTWRADWDQYIRWWKEWRKAR